MLSAKPLISVIIPTFNSERTICRCLDSILQQDYNKFEVIVIDGGSTDNTIHILKKNARVKVINSKRNILGYMRQIAVESSAGEIIAFVDSDMILPHKSWLKKMTDQLIKLKTLDNNVVSIFPLWRYSRNDKGAIRYTALYCNFILRRRGVLRDGDLLTTTAWGTGMTLILKGAIKAVGGFNPNVHYYDDADIADRLVANGNIFILSTYKSDEVTHIYADNFSSYLKKFYMMSVLGASQFGGELNITRELLSIPWSVLCMVREISREKDPVWMIHPFLQVARAVVRSLALSRYANRVQKGS